MRCLSKNKPRRLVHTFPHLLRLPFFLFFFQLRVFGTSLKGASLHQLTNRGVWLARTPLLVLRWGTDRTPLRAPLLGGFP